MAWGVMASPKADCGTQNAEGPTEVGVHRWVSGEEPGPRIEGTSTHPDRSAGEPCRSSMERRELTFSESGREGSYGPNRAGAEVGAIGVGREAGTMTDTGAEHCAGR